EVITRLARDGHSRSRELGRGINRSHIRPQQTGAALGLMHGSYACIAEYLQSVDIRAGNAANDFMAHDGILLTSRSIRLKRASTCVFILRVRPSWLRPFAESRER